MTLKTVLSEEVLPALFSAGRHYASLHQIIRVLASSETKHSPKTVQRYLHAWTREGRLHDAGRGWYSDLPDPLFPSPETPSLPRLREFLATNFPLLDYTLWSTRQLTGFFHHLPTRHATFLMVARDGMDPVADALREAGHHLVVHPLGAAAKNFALTEDETIILRPRLSSDHKEPFAPIEQILVDLYHEIQKLGLFDPAEYQRLFENIASRHRLNITALKRYAERRKIDSEELLKLGGII